MSSLALNLPSPPLQVTKPRWPSLARITPVTLSLLIHGALFIYFGASLFDDELSDNNGMPVKHGPISVRLMPVPVLTPVTTEPPKAIQPKPPAPRSIPVKLVNPAPIAKVQPRAVLPAKVPAKATAKAPVVVAEKAPAESPIEENDSHDESAAEISPAMTTVVATTPAPPIKQPSINGRQQAKQQYLATLMAHIEAHKHYPRAARQRGMEGQTTIRFTLLASGEICDISISNGPKLLRIASKNALQKALPLPAPPDTIDFPLSIQFNVDYRLI